MSTKLTNAAEFFNGEIPAGMALICGTNCERLTYDDSGMRLIDSMGRYGYRTQLGGLYVCYTCGHLCECGEE